MDYKKRPLWQWILIYIIIGGIIYALVYFLFIKGIYSKKSSSGGSNNPYGSSSQTTPNQASSNSTNSTSNETNTTAQTKNVTVSADDTGADQEKITVAKGTMINLTFDVKTGTTYHGGLEFVGENIDTGTITPGSSKTVQFTADKNFSFIPYWPANSVKKDYTVDIVVD